ncbi:MAG: ATP-dependent DNA helicase RecG [Candidatus Omnitrophota bacterium]
MLLNTSVRYLKGIGPKRAKVFNAAGINVIEDLLYYFPRRYEDRTKFVLIKDLKEGETQTIKAQVLAKGKRQSWRRRRFSIFELEAADNTGRVSCVWFNQPYLDDYFKVGSTVILYGKVERYGSRLQMSSPEFEFVSGDNDEALNIARIVPVYSLPAGLSQRTFRRFIKNILDEFLPKINDFLPFDIRSKNNLLNLAKALIDIHFPENFELQKEAFRRLSFEEFFLFQMLLVLRKAKKKQKQGIAHKAGGLLMKEYISGLPFELTYAQEQVIREIISDMAKPQAMQRLLQGDVGSGKTVVAVIAALTAIEGGYQAAIMAPTEVLARQHYEKIRCQVLGIRYQGRKIKICLLAGNANKKEKEALYRQIENGEVDLVIGTHALLEAKVKFKQLGLVVIDEQHKFGVGQRALLPQKGPNPDVLIMTATPIPRTLAITLYGDLDVSVIKQLPPGRIPVETLHFALSQQHKAYEIARQQLALGRQVFIVYPVIEESYALDIAGAKKMYERLRLSEFKDFKSGLIHGKMKQGEQDKIMAAFAKKEFGVLVCTTVLEVGIDIPEATCMIIEHSERFGLSQLHQLRGRVGRGPYKSFCVLVSDAQTEDAKLRIAAMLKSSDGFYVAEEDLRIRGPGEFFGRRQHGLAELKIGDPLAQMQLLKRAREEAIGLVEKDPHLLLRPNQLLKEKLLHRFPEYEELILIG